MSKAPNSRRSTNRTDRITTPISETTQAIADFLSYMESEAIRSGRTQASARFKEVMGKLATGCLSRIDVFHHVADIFCWHPQLLIAFNPLAPPGYSFELEKDDKNEYGNVIMCTPGSRILFGHYAIVHGKPQIKEEEATELMYPTEEELEAYRAEKRFSASLVPAQFPDSPDTYSAGAASTGYSTTAISSVIAQETGFKSTDEISVALAMKFFQKAQEKLDTPSNQAKFLEFIQTFSSPAECTSVHLPTRIQELFSKDPDLFSEMSVILTNARILRALENIISRWRSESGIPIVPTPPPIHKRESRVMDIRVVDPHLNPYMNPPRPDFEIVLCDYPTPSYPFGGQPRSRTPHDSNPRSWSQPQSPLGPKAQSQSQSQTEFHVGLESQRRLYGEAPNYASLQGLNYVPRR